MSTRRDLPQALPQGYLAQEVILSTAKNLVEGLKGRPFASLRVTTTFSRYNVTDPVYYEIAATAEAAIAREKQSKAGSRLRKIELIKSMNPTWRDLSAEV